MRVSRTISILILTLAAQLGFCQSPADNAANALRHEDARLKAEAAQHPFWDGQHKLTFALSGGLKVVDAVQTCHHFDNPKPGYHTVEDMAPVSSCGGVIAYLAAAQAGQLGLEYAFHRAGLHRLERFTPYVFMTASGIGIGYSFRNTARLKSLPSKP